MAQFDKSMNGPGAHIRQPGTSGVDAFSPSGDKSIYPNPEPPEADNQQHHELRQALQSLEQRYQSLLDNIPDVIYSLDEQGVITTINKAIIAYGYRPEEMIGNHFLDYINPRDREEVYISYGKLMRPRANSSKTLQFRLITRAGDIRWLETNCSIRFSPQGRFILMEGVCRDITKSVNNQNLLIKSHEELEGQVHNRTQELLKTNMELQKEIYERVATEKALLEREADLEMEKANLKQANTALKVLLKRREGDKKALEEQVLYNVKKLVSPYLNKIYKETSDQNIKTYLSIVESNLRDITCGFSRRLSLEFYGLSTSELKVANFIRQGKKNREIAALLGLSVRTVESFRQGIRNKLRIQNKKVNLRTFLMSIN